MIRVLGCCGVDPKNMDSTGEHRPGVCRLRRWLGGDVLTKYARVRARDLPTRRAHCPRLVAPGSSQRCSEHDQPPARLQSAPSQASLDDGSAERSRRDCPRFRAPTFGFYSPGLHRRVRRLQNGSQRLRASSGLGQRRLGRGNPPSERLRLRALEVLHPGPFSSWHAYVLLHGRRCRSPWLPARATLLAAALIRRSPAATGAESLGRLKRLTAYLTAYPGQSVTRQDVL